MCPQAISRYSQSAIYPLDYQYPLPTAATANPKANILIVSGLVLDIYNSGNMVVGGTLGSV